MLIVDDFSLEFTLKALRRLRALQRVLGGAYSDAIALEYEGSEKAGSDRIDEALAEIVVTIEDCEQAVGEYLREAA
ncbi:MAG: hypothetical protein QGI13_06805 [Rhodospirillales bacterium]|jgi:hypothetical protein|nr:hypothetical protein [Rhodospirillales bacterium]